ncbi:hypothetical protein BN14_11544 [Rhizoctonia solani AG-1 IB]|uniref:Laminin domain-containing protein n=1 Tax=Thanatephorus cucumeris (strain AG1-IB / isolate 7/3/14) TaxID=1108050 RepID=M5CBM1_THACB|nr:hypothetical protein BN14_11544 [Rhizoctonia solani AG-1 IB]
MVEHPGWYPPGQVCYPPDLPPYLKNVCDLKPIVGVPRGDELIGIHAVIQAAARASTIPGMHDPGLFTQLGDHLFSAQMAVYRSKYTSLLFPSDATYTPPALPAHVSVKLDPISCAPTDEQVTQVHEAIRSYQKFSEIPSMFEPRVHADLSQHLFDIQMARYMIQESQRKPNVTQLPGPIEPVERVAEVEEEHITAHVTSNNPGKGAESPQLSAVGVRDILQRSNEAAERANELSERSNQLIERSNHLAENLTGLLEKSNVLIEKPNQPTDQSSNDTLAQRFNELLVKLARHFERSNQLTEASKKPVEELGDVFKTINKVLVRIQHAIVRNNSGNTTSATRCLINDSGDMPTEFLREISVNQNRHGSMYYSGVQDTVGFNINGQNISATISDPHLTGLLRFYHIEGDILNESRQVTLKPREREEARKRLNEYWSSALGL